MLAWDLRHDEGILVRTPEGSLEASDFTTLANQVDAYLESHGTPRGVCVYELGACGWKPYRSRGTSGK
jgi:hypothetical protein